MLADFVPLPIVEEGLSIRVSVLDDTFNAISGAVPLPGGYTMIQTVLITPESQEAGRRYERVLTYLVSPRTGEGLYVGDMLPPVYSARQKRIYAAVAYSFPQVLILE